jgi:hypothetical protein
MAPVLDVTSLDTTAIQEIDRITGIIRCAYPGLHTRMINDSELVGNPSRFQNDEQLHDYLGFLQQELEAFRYGG